MFFFIYMFSYSGKYGQGRQERIQESSWGLQIGSIVGKISLILQFSPISMCLPNFCPLEIHLHTKIWWGAIVQKRMGRGRLGAVTPFSSLPEYAPVSRTRAYLEVRHRIEGY